MNKTQLNGLVELAKKKIDRKIRERKDELEKNMGVVVNALPNHLKTLASQYIEACERCESWQKSRQDVYELLTKEGAHIYTYRSGAPSIENILSPLVYKDDPEINRLNAMTDKIELDILIMDAPEALRAYIEALE